jgi:hypothetical protein
MNEIQLANRLRRSLNEGLALRLEPRVAQRLQAAREQALTHQRAEASAPSFVLAGSAGFARSHNEGFWPNSLRALAAAALLAVGLFSVYSWQQAHQIAELEEVDAQLLADDLPIDAYLDQGFKAWLKKTSAEE